MPKKTPDEMKAEYAAKKAPRRMGPPVPKPADAKDTPRRMGPPVPKPGAMPPRTLPQGVANAENWGNKKKLVQKTVSPEQQAEIDRIRARKEARMAALEAKRKSRSPRWIAMNKKNNAV